MLERRMQAQEETNYLLRIIAEVRKDHPTLSCRAMYAKLNPQCMGRDAFESMCLQHGFSSERSIGRPKTTNSNGVIRFDNLLLDMKLTTVNQAWVSDITYFDVKGQYYYITFIMDAFSRLIIGHSTSKRLFTIQTTLPALQMAIKTRKGLIPEGLIFHSDGGGQYYEKQFLRLTVKHKMRNSMCEVAYENGKAERLNGTIKNNYLRHFDIQTFEQLTEYVDRSVALYNTDRPHKSLGYKSPIDFEKKQVNLQ